MLETQLQDSLSTADFRRFRDIIYRQTGISLPDGKLTLLQSRLQKRLRALNLDTYHDYFVYLQDRDPQGEELQAMINRVTTNKTHFFREEHHFKYLRDVVFKSAIERAGRGERPKRLRIWSAACSSGEEPYTLAITVRETFARLPGWDIRILASDVDTDVLRHAEKGVYHRELVESLEPYRVKANFLNQGRRNSESVVVRPELRELITFKQINFAHETWPVHTTFDAIFCRNVLIYFDEQTQNQLVRRFAPYLEPEGKLFIGHSESLLRTMDVFKNCGPTIFELTDEARKQPEKPSLQAKPTTTSPPRPTRAPGVQQTQQPVVPPSSAPPQRPNAGRPKLKRLIVGDVVVSEIPRVVTTTLGSCIAVCLHDEVSRIGGMNHFALPSNEGSERLKTSFGVHAMELLINSILTVGGAKKRLKAKVFGAAKVLKDNDSSQVGAENEEFIRNFLDTEGIPVVAELLGGDAGMQVYFETSTGRARVKLLDQATAIEANNQSQKVEMPTSDITLF